MVLNDSQTKQTRKERAGSITNGIGIGYVKTVAEIVEIDNTSETVVPLQL